MSDYLARVAARAAGLRQQVESDRERNRREMPEATRIIDDHLASPLGKPAGGTFVEQGRTVRWGTQIAYSYAVQASVGPKRKERKRADSR